MPKKMLAAISRFFTLLFGKINWLTPPWINYLQQKAKITPRLFCGKTLGSLLILAAFFYAYHAYLNRPQPNRITAQINIPVLTPNNKVLVPDTLSIDFGLTKGEEFTPQSVAPIHLIQKEVTQGISIKPDIPGKWLWETDSHLKFTPAKDWPAGQTYTIQFNKNFFTVGVKMHSLSYAFTTLPFTANISEFKFYQNPLNPQSRQAIATLNFSYPVDSLSLENKITLTWQALKNANLQQFKFSITYDENKRSAYLHSEIIPLPQIERYLLLNLSKGIKPINGPSVTTAAITAKVLIPDAASYLQVNGSSSSIVRNQQDKPEQILTLATTIGVTAAEFKKSLHVYLLPQDYPATAAEEAKSNYHWQDPGAVTAAILALAKPIALQAIPTDQTYATLHHYQYQIPSGYLYIKLDKGMLGFGNFSLAHDYVAIVKSADFPQEISFLHRGSLLALGTEEKVSLLVRGLAAVKFNIGRVLPTDLNHLITQTAGDFSNPYFLNTSFNQDNISEIYSTIQQFDVSDPGKAQYTALDLSQFLNATASGGHLGLFLLQANAFDPIKKINLGFQANRLILITDLGLLVKDNIDGTHDFFVQSITNGSPVNNTSVALLGKNGLPLMTAITNNQGHVNFPNLKDFINEREPTVYVVRQNNDISFIPYLRSDRLLNYSRFDIGGITTTNSENQAALTAYIFSDRGIYRPGDTVHIAMIVKQPYVMPQPGGLPLEVTITDPRGVTVNDSKITLDSTGYLTFAFQASTATGQYLVNLFIVKDHQPSNLIGSSHFQVAEFLPDRLRITEHLSTEPGTGWISPTNLSAKIGLWNLYGAPAANHRIVGKILLTPHAVTFKEFPNYIFVDPLLNPKTPAKIFTDTLNDTQTNTAGQASFDLKLDRFEKATYQLTVFAEGFEAEGGRSVTTQTTALVSPLNYLVGYHADGDLDYIQKNGARQVHLIAINPQLKQMPLNDLTLQIANLHPVTTLIKKADGTFEYQSIMQTTEISHTPLTIPETGLDYTLPTKTIGNYLITITDKNGTDICKFKYSIIGNSQQPLPKNAELNVKLNKIEYAPGETIEMQITAPYTGAGLITIERDKVYSYQWFKTNTTSSIQKIQLPKNLQGNGYVNIAFVRDLNSPEIFLSPLSYSVTPFSVTHQQQKIDVNLSTPHLLRPGDILNIVYSTDKPGKIIVFAVDEGILQVTKYQTPDPLKFFFEKHALEVTTQQIVDQILPKFMSDRELSAVGGDSGEAALRNNLNPFKRKTEAPVVYWSGIVDTDSTPRNLSYQIPDYFNGNLQVMAVAVAPDAVGAAKTNSEIRGYFVINPNVPTFVAPGDEFEVTASIANNVDNAGKNANISVSLQTNSALEILGEKQQKIIIAPGEERTVHYRIRAKSQLGSAQLKLTATLNDKSSVSTATLSIRPPIAYSTKVNSGHAIDRQKTIKLDSVLYPDYEKTEAAISVSPLILVSGLENYLNNYPYGCVEQLVSKAFPWLVMANQAWLSPDSAALTDKIQKTIQLLSQRQMSNGGFNYWPEVGTTSSNDFASVYAMHFLTEAKARGYNVPNDIFSAGIGFLKILAMQNMTSMDEARLHAYAIYLLTRNEIVTTNYLTNLQLALEKTPAYPWHNDITSVYLAATYQLLKSGSDAEKLIQYYQPQSQKGTAQTDFYNKDIANAQYIYLLAEQFPDRLKKLNDNTLITLISALNTDSMTTILAGYASLALSAYGEMNAEANDNLLSISETLKNGQEIKLSATNGLYQKTSIDNTAQQINFSNPNRLNYFYQFTQAGFAKNPPPHVINQGIEVFRELDDEKNNVVTSVKLGDEVYVHIRARSTTQQYQNNVVLIDLLPGGFEVVRDSFNANNVDYVEMREDRVLFFGSVGSESKEIIYRIKATNIGDYSVPPMFGMSMYNPQVKSIGLATRILVHE